MVPLALIFSAILLRCTYVRSSPALGPQMDDVCTQASNSAQNITTLSEVYVFFREIGHVLLRPMYTSQ